MQLEREGETLVIRTPAQLAGSVAGELPALARQAFEQFSSPVLVVDMGETEFVDSSGIGHLVAVARFFREAGNDRLALRGLSHSVEGLFAETGLDKLFNIQTQEGVRRASYDLFAVSAEIRLDVRAQVRGQVCILHMGGVMSHPVGSGFLKQQVLLSLAQCRNILLDMEELTFFDSLSVGVILTLNELIVKTGGSLRICGANFIVDELFTTLSINRIIPGFPSVDAALADWEQV